MKPFPLFPIMFLILFTLKVIHKITWSWWMVTAPLWAGFILLFCIYFVAGVIREVAKLRR